MLAKSRWLSWPVDGADRRLAGETSQALDERPPEAGVGMTTTTEA
jgi:hypothetical protein